MSLRATVRTLTTVLAQEVDVIRGVFGRLSPIGLAAKQRSDVLGPPAGAGGGGAVAADTCSKPAERTPIAVELDEFLKAGGSAKCLTLRVDGEEAAVWD